MNQVSMKQAWLKQEKPVISFLTSFMIQNTSYMIVKPQKLIYFSLFPH